MIRLDKYISENLPCTRSEAKKYIGFGRVSVDGKIIRDPDTKIDEKSVKVFYKDRELLHINGLYFMLNKPSGVISATEDKNHRTVLELFPAEYRKKLFPVGRLDLDTEGLLLVTDDGDFCHRIESPKKKMFKTYYVCAVGMLLDNAPELFEKGMILSDFTAKPAFLEILSEKSCYDGENGSKNVNKLQENDSFDKNHLKEYELIVKITEGKFHQVKRMVHEAGCEVRYLKRIAIGELKLDESLAPGEYRSLSEEELAILNTRA